MKAAALIFIVLLPVLACGEPVIVFDNPVHDFGAVRQGEVLEHTFQISNSGTDDLLIEKVLTS